MGDNHRWFSRMTKSSIIAVAFRIPGSPCVGALVRAADGSLIPCWIAVAGAEWRGASVDSLKAYLLGWDEEEESFDDEVEGADDEEEDDELEDDEFFEDEDDYDEDEDEDDDLDDLDDDYDDDYDEMDYDVDEEEEY
ncbi:MAG: hypothetical protein AB1656_23040 [Candidatus Omnitrophota bacterium]